MGRLTLNVLLSFAQFEREVTGERIRDKIAASKARGMWMGGSVPLGYEVKDRKLIDRAKGLLMQRQGLSEQEAYDKLRKAAMDRGLKLADVAQRMLDMADLLG